MLEEEEEDDTEPLSDLLPDERRLVFTLLPTVELPAELLRVLLGRVYVVRRDEEASVRVVDSGRTELEERVPTTLPEERVPPDSPCRTVVAERLPVVPLPVLTRVEEELRRVPELDEYELLRVPELEPEAYSLRRLL